MDLSIIEKNGGRKERERIQKHLSKFVAAGFIVHHQSNASLTDEGMLGADGIAAEMFKY